MCKADKLLDIVAVALIVKNQFKIKFIFCGGEGDYTATKNIIIQDNCSESLTCRNCAPVTLNITSVSLDVTQVSLKNDSVTALPTFAIWS